MCVCGGAPVGTVVDYNTCYALDPRWIFFISKNMCVQKPKKDARCPGPSLSASFPWDNIFHWTQNSPFQQVWPMRSKGAHQNRLQAHMAISGLGFFVLIDGIWGSKLRFPRLGIGQSYPLSHLYGLLNFILQAVWACRNTGHKVTCSHTKDCSLLPAAL